MVSESRAAVPQQIADIADIVNTVLKDHRIGHKNVVSQDRWSLVTSSVTMKCIGISVRNIHVHVIGLQDKWPPMAVVSQHSFQYIKFIS